MSFLGPLAVCMFYYGFMFIVFLILLQVFLHVPQQQQLFKR